MPGPESPRWQRVAAGVGAFVTGDLIVGFAAFSSITLASLWYFSWEWIHLRAEYLAHGLTFGSTWQLGLAWFAVLAALPLLALTVFLAVRAMEVPRRLYSLVRAEVPSVPARADGRSHSDAVRTLGRPNYLASFRKGAP
jgi:hypothetical protein